MPTLSIKNLKVTIDKKPILQGVNLNITQGGMHAIMGPNGSGKSTLAQTLFHHPKYIVTKGAITFRSKKLNGLTTDKIARLGLLLAFQYPQSISGVSVMNLVKIAGSNQLPKKTHAVPALVAALKQAAADLQLPEEFLSRSLNEGFSGGEKKKMEIMQLTMLAPKLVVVDEIDSGLDVDALKAVAEKINELRAKNTSILIITHYSRILHYIKPDYVHIMHHGRIVRSGDVKLAGEIEKYGYQKFIGKSDK